MTQENYIPDVQKELKDLATAQDKKIVAQRTKIECLKQADQRFQEEAEDVLRIVDMIPGDKDAFVIESVEEYAKTEKISLLAAKAQVLKYLSPEWRVKVDAEVTSYFKNFDMDKFVALKPGSPASEEAIKTLKILCDEGYTPLFLTVIRYQDDPEKKEVAFKWYQWSANTPKGWYQRIFEGSPFEDKEGMVLDDLDTEAEAYFRDLKNILSPEDYEYVIDLATKYLTVEETIGYYIKDFDCDETALFIQAAMDQIGVESGGYLRTANHTVLKFNGLPIVFDLVGNKIRSIDECARQHGYGEGNNGSYFWRDENEEYLAEYEDGNNFPKKIISYKKTDNQYLVRGYGHLSALINEKAENLVNSGELEKAKSYYKKSLEIEPNDSETCVNFANLLNRLEDPKGAKSYYERALQLNPNEFTAYTGLSILLFNSKSGLIDILSGKYPQDREKLKSYCEKALQLDPNHPLANVNFAKRLWITGDPTNARVYLERAKKLDINGLFKSDIEFLESKNL